ncbi:MAG TPA: right-handed parallel beta-helix repeat-containing protein, partial [Gammaproteobacteria bacterium]|nr:right-handed parallel beta-helix repeat-containing protein [Gammaproteobacteria bacterium]
MRLYFAHLLLIVGSLGAWSADAATYYVRNGGNDSADGKSHATAWASLSKVNGYSFATGDRVLFHEGDRWVGTLTVDWAGTSSQRAVVGSYYLDGSTPVRGYRTSQPIIDGENRLPTNSPYVPLVFVGTAWVTVENLHVQNSAGQGIGINGVAEVEIIGCKVSNVYTAGIHFKKTQAARAENNYVTMAGIGNRKSGIPWGASIEAVGAKSTIVRNNTIDTVWGEGINAHSGSQYTMIEHNRLFAVHSAGIYSDGSPDTTIRRNIVVGTSNSTWWRGGSSVGPGIAINNEKYHYPVGGGNQSLSVQSKRAKIYGNLVAYTRAGIAVWASLAESI